MILTFSFTAKRDDDATDTRGEYTEWVKRPGYRIPVLTASHVETPRAKWDTRVTLMMQTSARDADIREARQRRMLEAAGLDTRHAFEGDPGVTIVPRGNGFMARVTLQLEVAPRPAVNA